MSKIRKDQHLANLSLLEEKRQDLLKERQCLVKEVEFINKLILLERYNELNRKVYKEQSETLDEIVKSIGDRYGK